MGVAVIITTIKHPSPNLLYLLWIPHRIRIVMGVVADYILKLVILNPIIIIVVDNNEAGSITTTTITNDVYVGMFRNLDGNNSKEDGPSQFINDPSIVPVAIEYIPWVFFS